MSVTIANGDLGDGGRIVTLSTGTKVVVFEDGDTIEAWKDVDGTPSQLGSGQAPATWGGSGSSTVGHIDAGLDNNDDLHIIVANGFDDTRDIAYVILSGIESSPSWGTWEEAAGYTNAAPTTPWATVSLDSNDKPHICFTDEVKMTGTARDNVYYSEKTGASWATPTKIGLRDTKTDEYTRGNITLKGTDYIEVTYDFVTDGDLAYKTYTGTWSGESVYTETDAITPFPGITIASGGTVYRYHATDAGDIEENNVDTGYNTNASSYRRVSPSMVSDDRYVFYIDSNRDVHLISNDGGGWTDEGALQTGTYEFVIAEWHYNNLNFTTEISYLFGDGTNVYYDEFTLGPTYTMPAVYGTFTLSGQAADLEASRLLTAAYGSFSLAGQATGLLKQWDDLIAAYGSFSLAGQATGLLASRLLPASYGTFALSGQATGLLASRLLVASYGTFTLSGQDAELSKLRILVAAYGSFSLAGQATGLYKQWADLVAAYGSFSLAGQATGLLASRLLAASYGTFALSGQAAGLLASRLLTASYGTFTLSGQAADLEASRLLAAAYGTFTLSGQDAGLVYSGAGGYTLVANYGTFTLSGQATGLYKQWADLVAAYGSFSLAGQATGLLASRLLAASYGTFTLSGQATGLLANRLMAAAYGTFALSGQAAGLLASRVLAASYGTFTLSGQDAGLIYSLIKLIIESDAYIIRTVEEDSYIIQAVEEDANIIQVVEEDATLRGDLESD